MHFLSHFYFELPAKSPFFIVGLSIPDLTPGFSKAYNQSIKNCVLPQYPPHLEIHQGILSHYEADKAFHNSPVFMSLLEQTIQSFTAAGISRERLRLSVIAHLAVELMIDRHILLEHEQICTDYYNLLNEANEEVIGGYFDSHLTGDKKRSFLTKFQLFKQRRFLFLFKEVEHIVTGLSRIYENTTRVAFTDDEKRNFFSALNNIDTAIRYSWKEILNSKVYE